MLLFLCLLSASATAGNASSPQNITKHFSSIRLAYQSPTDSSEYTAVAESFFSGKHAPVLTHPPETTGLLGREALWYMATLPAGMLSDDRWVVEIPYALSYVNMWFKAEDGRVIPLQSGAFIDPDNRKTTTPSFYLPENNGHDINLLVRVASGAPVLFKALLWKKAAWDAHQHWLFVWYGLLFGVVGALLIYNLFLSIGLREVSYVYYILYLSFMALLVMDISGLRRLYTPFQDFSLAYLAMASAFGLAFCNRFLNLRALSPAAWWLSMAIIVLDVFLGLQNFSSLRFIHGYYVLLGVLGLSGIAAIYYLLAPIYAYLKGVRPARFLIASFAVITAAFYLYIAKLLGAEYPEMATHRIIEIAIVSEALLLSLALADRINLLNRDKELAEQQAMESQKLFSRRFIKVQELERESFSNTLHDAIGHGLLVLRQNLEKQARGMGAPDADRKQIDSLMAQCGDVLEDVRDLSHDLHPHTLRRLGLKTAIESTMERAFSSHGIDWVANISLAEEQLPEEQKIAIYRIVQEAINNVLKHSGAREVILAIESTDDEILLEIKDDGKGIPPQENIENGIGFSTMKGRAQLLGGRMKIHSSASQGTKLQFEIPLK